VEIGVLEVGNRSKAVGGGGKFELEEAIVVELFFFYDAALCHENFEGEGKGDEGILERAENRILGLKEIEFLFEAELDEGILGRAGSLLLGSGEVFRSGSLLFLDEGEKEVCVVETADAEIEGIIEDLAEEEVASVGLHLFEILVNLGDGHDAGSADVGIIGGLAGIFT